MIGTAIVSNGPEPVLGYSAYGVRSNSDGNAFAAQRFDARKIGLDRGIAEAPLALLRRLLETRLRVGSHQQYNPYAGFTASLQDSFRHGVGLRVRLSSRLLVYIVKFPHAAVAGRQHLSIGLLSQCIKSFRS